MKPILVILALLVLSASTATANIWRVDSDPTNDADFRTLQQAHDAVSAGDTLYVAGSTIDYQGVNFSKKLYIVGPGYFLSGNPMTQAFKLPANIGGGNVAFNAGSQGSVITGMLINVNITISVDNVTLKRNRISNCGNPNAINIFSGASSIVITQNYITESTCGGLVDDAILVTDASQDVIITNNYIEHPKTASDSHAIEAINGAVLQIVNNVITCNGGGINVRHSVVYNNILISGTFVFSDNDVQHNLSDQDQFGNQNGNQEFVNMATVFVGATGNSADGQWQLQVGSPALGAGINGEDAGMYGGAAPYVLSGLPAIPSIYFFTGAATGTTSQGLPVQVSITSHN